MEIEDRVRQALASGDREALRPLIIGIGQGELRDLWHHLEAAEQRAVFRQLGAEDRAALVTELSPAQQEQLILSLTARSIHDLLDDIAPDDLIDLLQAIPPQAREAAWAGLDQGARSEAEFLLRFDSDDAAGIMTPRCIAVRGSLTVRAALGWVRRSLREPEGSDLETVYYIYVVDGLKRLIGVVSIRDLLGAEDEQLIANVMESEVVMVPADLDQEEVARTLEDNDLHALPVVDAQGRLLGVVTFDDVLDVIQEEHSEDVYRMGAMSGGAERYVDSSIWALFRRRLPWLAVLLVAATVTTNVLDAYRPLLEMAAVLVIFIPIVTGTGGNSGTQSATLMIRGLATHELQFRDALRVSSKEVLVGLSLGLAVGALAVARSLLLPPYAGLTVGLTVGVAMVFVVTVASVIGALAPLVIARLGMDPAVMAGPLMSTVIDVAGLTIYFQTTIILMRL